MDELLSFIFVKIQLMSVNPKMLYTVKYLSMYLDSYLSWEYHIHELSQKLSRANGILSKLRYNSPFEVCLQVNTQ